jgi:23S rRNA (pseudouridine1915-N3)-methyltransferase
MHKIKILSVGKTKEPWLEEALAEYLKRLQGMISIEFILAKNDEQLLNLASKESTLICLDPKGEAVTSEQFCDCLFNNLSKGGCRLAFVIGGPEGLPSCLRIGSYPLISFSHLTFTHQIARLILVEQIYRAVEISKGTKYHK